mmetsp:Transcript_7325/g.22334  ORF Transcript_7325/g.22334 Transcript_7325/m.22334 type:complete len:534 (+) Transcript_7325:201-1802(+)|eukprot:CAMPEP_0198727638 /NCGR_PEP_ID=MMETSP1475-20131203/4600_1 /TAXON_ID= ORGANISM="Unidentified sp., Strain CCMP1999" /NCGR_SAMPLE_ID=MMETSP1475 /ASSEMBLY_ACC=CAM_ASM_001111 /LENGTH=533 /DNA_ID=CAMNT_0044489711 /DNA_START=165 /DNA_END=1766 /DNA_ORIENTATION=+
MSSYVQVISEGGELTDKSPWFDEDEELEQQAMKIISILGPQGSGKSTLLNDLFGTSFKVSKPGGFGASTTKGIQAAKARDDELLLVLDVEGADARERGRGGKGFMAKCSGFAFSLSDIVIINLWFHDIGRLDNASYTCLEAVLNEQARALAEMSEEDDVSSKIYFAVRDVDEQTSEQEIKARLQDDVNELWDKVNGPNSATDYFDLDYMFLPHFRYHRDGFDSAIQSYKDINFETKYSRGIAAESLSAYASKLWRDVYQPAFSGDSAGDLPTGNENAVLKSDTAFSKALKAAQTDIDQYAQKLGDGETVSNFGDSCKKTVDRALEVFDVDTSEYETDTSVIRKKDELRTVLDAALKGLFIKQLQLIRDRAMANFKSGTSDESPADFVFFQVDNYFVREAEASVMPGSDWSYQEEREFLKNMMQDLATQKRKLLEAQMMAAQESQQALRYLQMQEGRMHQIQQQHYGGVLGAWNIGAAYRPPDSNVNISVGYQQGRTSIQISMVPDEQAGLLGPNGFTAGVGPANLGLSFNINV